MKALGWLIAVGRPFGRSESTPDGEISLDRPQWTVGEKYRASTNRYDCGSGNPVITMLPSIILAIYRSAHGVKPMSAFVGREHEVAPALALSGAHVIRSGLLANPFLILLALND